MANHGTEINQQMYWIVVGIKATGAQPSCDGCGPDTNEAPPFRVLTNNRLTIPNKADGKQAYVLQGDWAKDMADVIVGAKPFKTSGDANTWIAKMHNDLSDNFFAKYVYVLAVPVKISTAFWGE